MPKLTFIPKNGRIPTEDRLQREVQRLLTMDHDAVIALTDVYTGSTPPEFTNAADAKQKMRRWVGRAEHRFHPHAAQYEFEAWLLPYWSIITSRAGSDRRPPSPNPESVNHNAPPSAHLHEVFRTGHRKKRYSKVIDGLAILRQQDLSVAAAACPELKAFLNTILTLSGGTPL
jgi:hypothetical protein